MGINLNLRELIHYQRKNRSKLIYQPVKLCKLIGRRLFGKTKGAVWSFDGPSLPSMAMNIRVSIGESGQNPAQPIKESIGKKKTPRVLF